MYEMIKVTEKRKHTEERKGPTAVSRSPELPSSQDTPGPHYSQTAYLQTATSSPCSLTTLPSHTSSSPVLFSGAVILKLCHFPAIPQTPDPILTLAIRSVRPAPPRPALPAPAFLFPLWLITDCSHFLVQCFWPSYYIFLIINRQPPKHNYRSLLLHSDFPCPLSTQQITLILC